MEGGGPTYAARSLLQYISAFATRVLQWTSGCVKGERAWALILKLLTPGINSAIFSLKNHHVKNVNKTYSSSLQAESASQVELQMSEILEDLFDDNNNVNLAPVDTKAGLGETDLK